MVRRLRLVSSIARAVFLVAPLGSLALSGVADPSAPEVVGRYALAVVAVGAAIVWGVTGRRASRLDEVGR